MKIKYLLLIALFALFAGCSKSHNADIYGEGVTIEKPTSLEAILSDPAAHIGKEFRVEGTIVDVCQKKGCWMDLQDGDSTITVRFKDYAFFMPKDGTGLKATVQGIFTVETYEDEQADGTVLEKKYNNFIASGVILEKPEG